MMKGRILRVLFVLAWTIGGGCVAHATGISADVVTNGEEIGISDGKVLLKEREACGPFDRMPADVGYGQSGTESGTELRSLWFGCGSPTQDERSLVSAGLAQSRFSKTQEQAAVRWAEEETTIGGEGVRERVDEIDDASSQAAEEGVTATQATTRRRAVCNHMDHRRGVPSFWSGPYRKSYSEAQKDADDHERANPGHNAAVL